MAFADDLRAEIRAIFRSQWSSRDGIVVPDNDDVGLGNEAVKLNATVLYADLADSTEMVNRHKAHFAAEAYKTFLLSACRVIRSNGGIITAFDGDRVMAVFVGDEKNTTAAKTALQIRWTVDEIVNPELRAQYQNSSFSAKYGVGIDSSSLWVARAGIRGSNDLVWVGRAANYAAKLCALREEGYTSWITAEVFNRLHDSSKYGKDGKLMWEKRIWTERSIDVYRSNWRWSI